MTEFQRARNTEQKTQRLDAILNAASGLFDQSRFSEVTIREIASAAGLGKASIYHYFQSKEEVFLALFLLELNEWIDEFQSRVSALDESNSDKLASLITTMMVERPRYSRLHSLLSLVLERNVPVDQLREFKTNLLAPFSRLIEILCGALPHLSPEGASEFLLQFHAVVAGLWPLAHPNQELADAINTPELEVFQVDFETSCHALLVKLLR